MLIDRNSLDASKFWNRFLGMRAYTQGEPVNPAHPVELIIEITDHCNLACPMCPRPNMTRTVGHMKLDLFRHIIDQIKGYIELVYISGGLGEPFMHPDFFDMVRCARESGVRLGVSTNATLLWPKAASRLLDCPPNLLLLSLDGATKETVESIRIGSTFEKTMANVENFVLEKERRGLSEPYAVVQMIYMPQNKREADMFRERWSKFKGVDDIRLKRFLHLQGADNVPEEEQEDHRELSCVLPWRQLSIAYDGSLALCCRDLNFAYPIGDASTHTIEQLWNSEAMVKHRELLATKLKARIPLCAGCSTVKTTPASRAGAVIFDDFTIRKLLPLVEKVAIKAGLDIGEY